MFISKWDVIKSHRERFDRIRRKQLNRYCGFFFLTLNLYHVSFILLTLLIIII